MKYDLSDSFPFDFEPNVILFGDKKSRNSVITIQICFSDSEADPSVYMIYTWYINIYIWYDKCNGHPNPPQSSSFSRIASGRINSNLIAF